MLVIVEGPDCVGKSTFCAELIKHAQERHLLTKLLHRGPPTSHPLDEYEVPLLDPRLTMAGTFVVCDRWHLGELVYPRVLNRPTKLTPGVMFHIEQTLLARGAQLVVMQRPADDAQACLERRGEDPAEVERASALRDEFLTAAVTSRLPTHSLDTSDSTSTLTIDSVSFAAMDNTVRVRQLTDFVTYVGPRFPKLLLLGDVRGTGMSADDHRPAFMPYPGTSGAYLCEVLAPLTGDVGLANACDVDDPLLLWNELGRPETVVLGRNAQAMCPWADRYVPHPQYWRRFKHHRHDEYRELIAPQLVSVKV